MKKKKIKAGAIALALVLTAVTLNGCGGARNANQKTEGKARFTWWTELYPHVAQTANNFGDIPFYKGLMERTNTEIEFIHPPAGQAQEKFNLLLSSADLPDFIEYNFLNNYRGGPKKAIQDGVLFDLKDAYQKYAPNLTKLLKENPEWDKQIKLDDGGYYIMPFLRGDDYLLSWMGPQIRQDLLEKLNLPAPETIDEWDKTLRAFKAAGVEYPLTFQAFNFAQHSMFVGAFGITSGLFVENGKVQLGETRDEYLDFLKLLNGWYKDGLLDPEFFAQDGKVFNSKVVGGKVAAWVNSAGGGLGTLIPALKQSIPEAKLAGVKFAVKEKGTLPQFGFKEFAYSSGTSVGISTSCKDLKAAVSFFDWGYGEEGSMYWNFGEEGVSYKMENGYPKYTDAVTNDQNGLAMQFSMSKYMASAYGGPFLQDKREYEQYMQFPEQKDALVEWGAQDKANDHRIPPVTLNQEESAAAAAILANINTYQNEKLLKIITGQEPLSEFETFRNEMRKFEANRYIEIYQNAYDRYLARK